MIKAVIDTNVFVSGIFWKGPPHQILIKWRQHQFGMLITPDILSEYRRVLNILNEEKDMVDVDELLKIVTASAIMTQPVKLKKQICRDPDDDKFLAAAIGGKADFVVTGDKVLLGVKMRAGFQVVTPQMYLTLLNSF